MTRCPASSARPNGASAADRVLPSSIELGGHDAGLVFADADLESTADAVVAGQWRNCGQA